MWDKGPSGPDYIGCDVGYIDYAGYLRGLTPHYRARLSMPRVALPQPALV
jgi:hypothetical protein